MPLQVFPVSGTEAKFSNDFGFPRSGGRTHKGTDIFAPEGTPLLAVDDGTLKFGTDPLGGNIAKLTLADGTFLYYAHLQGFQGGNRQVRAGEVIGYLGKTGNAAGTPPHLHFEVHPGGGEATNPYPLLINAPRRAATQGSSSSSAELVTIGLALAAAGYLGTRLYYSVRPIRRTVRG